MISRKISPMRTIISLILILTLFSGSGLINSFTQGTRIPTSTTVPPITTTSPGVIYNCQPLIAFPGSVVIGTSGFVRIKCPSTGALTLGTTTGIVLTPTFVLTLGYANISIILSQSGGNPCNDNFRIFMVGNATLLSGTILTGAPLTFSSSPQAGQFLATDYDYCLQYVNVALPLNGFTVTWT